MKTSARKFKINRRIAVDQVGKILQRTTDADRGVRAAAFDALGLLGGTNELPTVLGIIAKADTDDDRASAEKAAVSMVAHISQKASVASAVATAQNGASIAPARAR